MMKNVIFILFLLVTASIYSQNIPDWLKMGMIKDEIERNLNGQKLSHKNNDTFISVSLQNYIIYQYNIDVNNGLNQYWIIGLYFDYNKIIDNFTLFYGIPIINNDQYWWYDFKNILPIEVKAICISAKGDAVNIA